MGDEGQNLREAARGAAAQILAPNGEGLTLLGRLGRNVREIRRQKSYSREALAALSGISLRYLAELEAGRGNMSLALIERLASALECDVIDLLREQSAPPDEFARLRDYFILASPEIRKAAIAFLSGGEAGAMRAKRIALIGLRGAGKSSLGKMLGKRLAVPFVELNSQIESEAGMPISEIIALYGQEGYRRLEADALEAITRAHERVILAVAGGIVSEAATYARLLSHFHTIWLRATPEEHMERVRAQGDERPMKGNPAAMEKLRSILTSREALYGQALATLDTSGSTPEQSAKELAELINTEGLLR